MFSSLINPAIILISLSTATGVFLHDTRLDKAASVGMSVPIITASYEANTKTVNLGGDFHTHSERSVTDQVMHDLKNQNPRIQPRTLEDKKHLLQKHTVRGHHAFDNYNLPLV